MCFRGLEKTAWDTHFLPTVASVIVHHEEPGPRPSFICDCCWCYWEGFCIPTYPRKITAGTPKVEVWKMMFFFKKGWFSGSMSVVGGVYFKGTKHVKPSWMSLTPEIQTRRTSIPPLDRGGGSRLLTRLLSKAEFTNASLLIKNVCCMRLYKEVSSLQEFVAKVAGLIIDPAEYLKSQDDHKDTKLLVLWRESPCYLLMDAVSGKKKTYTLRQTSIAGKSQSLLVNTIQIVDFPRLC